MNDNLQQIAYRIDDDVSLAAIDPLEGIKATLPTSFGCFDTLGVLSIPRLLGLPCAPLPSEVNYKIFYVILIDKIG
jgi:hypothetical protein